MNVCRVAVSALFALGLSGCVIANHRSAEPPEPTVNRHAASSPALDRDDAELNRLCERGDWEEAARHCRLLFSACRTDQALVLRGTQLAILNWNSGNRTGAIIAMDTVITACSRLGEGRDAAAVRFRNDLRKGRVDGKFTVEEAVYLVGIRKAIADEALR